jgi:hypothetical protein
MPNAVMLAFTQPTSAATEDAYNEWYNTKHLHDLVAIDGVIAATRYKIAQDVEAMPGVTGPPQGYLAIYEIEGDTEADLETFAATLRAALADGRADISPNLDMAMLGASLCLPVSARLERVDTSAAATSS